MYGIFNAVFTGTFSYWSELKALLVRLAEAQGTANAARLTACPTIWRGSLAEIAQRKDSNADVACDAVCRHALTPFKRPGRVNGVSLNIDGHDNRHVLHIEFIDGFHA